MSSDCHELFYFTLDDIYGTIFLEGAMNIKRIDVKDFDYFYSLLEQDFCYEERRLRDDELKVFSNELFHPYFIYEDKTIVGYLCFWEFDDFIFGEHFAILKEIRDRALGSTFLKEFMTKLDKPFVFEIEIPFDELSKRRKNFYNRLGVAFNKYKYSQPSYHNDDKVLPMIFASYPKPLSKKEFNRIVNLIRINVYNVEPI